MTSKKELRKEIEELQERNHRLECEITGLESEWRRLRYRAQTVAQVRQNAVEEIDTTLMQLRNKLLAIIKEEAL